MVNAFRYYEWDGTQEIPPLDPDELLEALTDDLMNFGDLQHALRNLLQRGMRNPMGQRLEGLRDLLQQLRQQRRQTLDRFNLGSAFDDIQQKLDAVLDMERETIERRLSEALGEKDNSPDGAQPDGSDAGQRDGQPGEQQQGSPSQSSSSQGGSPQAGGSQQGGQQSSSGSQQSSDNSEFAQMLQNIAERKRQFLEGLPEDMPGKIKELQNYEFMDPEAQAQFTELMDMLKKAMTETFFKDIHQQISNMSPEDMTRMKDMVRELNEMLSERMAGGEPDFDGFMQKYGDLFGPNPPQSLDELIAQMQQQIANMQNLLDSLPADMRRQLQDLLMDKIGDPDLQGELSELQSNLEMLYPMRDLRNQYPFRGDEDLDLNQAMELMGRMSSMDELER